LGSIASIEQHPWHVGFTPDRRRVVAMQRNDAKGPILLKKSVRWHCKIFSAS